MICKNADNPYVVGEVVSVPGTYNGGGQSFGVEVSRTSTNVIIRTAAQGIRLSNDTGDTATSMTLTNWRYVVRAWK